MKSLCVRCVYVWLEFACNANNLLIFFFFSSFLSRKFIIRFVHWHAHFHVIFWFRARRRCRVFFGIWSMRAYSQFKTTVHSYGSMFTIDKEKKKSETQSCQFDRSVIEIELENSEKKRQQQNWWKENDRNSFRFLITKSLKRNGRRDELSLKTLTVFYVLLLHIKNARKSQIK